MRMNNVGMGQTTRYLGLAVHQFLQQMHGVGWILVLKIQFALNDVGNVVADVGLGVGFKQLVAQQAHRQYPLLAQFQNQGRVESVGDVLVFGGVGGDEVRMVMPSGARACAVLQHFAQVSRQQQYGVALGHIA